MKPTQQLMREIREAGLIYDPVITSFIIGYEVGHFQRDIFYASMVGDTKDEQQLKAGHLANAKVEFSDLVTQCRIFAEINGWDWQEVLETGEAKLQERIDTYKQRGVRPQNKLMDSFLNNGMLPSPPKPRVRPQREGD